MKVPVTVGVPLMVITLLNQVAVKPEGKPVGIPMPVATVVVCVIACVNAVLRHKVGVEEGAEAVLVVFTIIVPVAFTVPQPPVNGIE